MKEFLEALHDGSDEEASSDLLKEFVYNVIKTFAKENPDYYQQSNLIELMNYVVDKRRGDIFEPETSVNPSPGQSNRGISGFQKSGTIRRA